MAQAMNIEEQQAKGGTLVQRSLFSELRALLAAARKEWIIFGRYPSWVVAFFIWPVLFPLSNILRAKALGGPDGSALSTFAQLAGTTDYVSFMVVGSTMWMWLNFTLWSVGFQLRDEQKRGTLESNWLCPVPRISVMLGASLTDFGTALMLLAITVVEFRLFFGVRLLQGNLALLLLVVFLVIPTIYGLGLAFASLVVRFKEANAMVFLVRGIFMIFCGMSYPLAVLPGWMRRIASLLPLTYAIRSVRAVTLAGATFVDILPDLQILATFAIVMPALGYGAFRLAERRSRRMGTLGQY
jgi:ABC-2 type transport system permease protein